jgi:hypothetical protein
MTVFGPGVEAWYLIGLSQQMPGIVQVPIGLEDDSGRVRQ